MEIEYRSRLIIRCDWEDAIKNEGSVWTTYKKAGEKSIQGALKRGVNVKGVGCRGDACPKLLDAFYGKLLNNGKLKLSYYDEDGGMEVLVQCPSHNFTHIHANKTNINSIAVSHKGYGVSCDSDGAMLLWGASRGVVKHSLQGHTGEVNRCAFFPSGVVVLSGGVDMKLKIWSAEDAKCVATLVGHTRGISDMAFLDRGKNIVSSSRDGFVRLWSVSQSKTLHSFHDLDNQPINCCIVQPAWGGLKLTPPTHRINEHECKTEGRVLVGGSEGGRVMCWALQNRKQILHYASHSAVNSVAFTTDHTIVCGCDDSTLHLVDLRHTKRAVRVVKEGRGAVLSVCRVGAGCVAVGTADGSCYSVDNDLTLLREMSGSDLDPVREVTCDENHVYTACRDGVIRKYPIV